MQNKWCVAKRTALYAFYIFIGIFTGIGMLFGISKLFDAYPDVVIVVILLLFVLAIIKLAHNMAKDKCYY